MKQKQWYQNDDLFIRELREGHRWQLHVANRLGDVGLKCYVPQLEVRDDISDAERFINSKDVVCMGAVLEIKSRRLSFRSPDTFPYSTVFVDTVSGWEAKDPKPYAYVCVSTISGAIIYTDGRSKDLWEAINKRDRVRDIEETFYSCPIEYWQPFESLVEELNKLITCHSNEGEGV